MVETHFNIFKVLLHVTVELPPCLQKFDVKFRQCLDDIPIVVDDFFSVISNQADNKTIQNVCDRSHNNKVLRCGSDSLKEVTEKATECSQREVNEVQMSVKNTMAAYEGKCKCIKYSDFYNLMPQNNIDVCKTQMPPFPNIWKIGLTFDLLTWVSIGIIYSTRTIYLPSLKLVGQSVLELSVAQGEVDWHDLWPWTLTYWPEYQ